jgi:hypothetical protein
MVTSGNNMLGAHPSRAHSASSCKSTPEGGMTYVDRDVKMAQTSLTTDDPSGDETKYCIWKLLLAHRSLPRLSSRISLTVHDSKIEIEI